MPEKFEDPITTVEEATYVFTLGDTPQALTLLRQALEKAPDCFEAWHALAEIHSHAKNYCEALNAAEQAYILQPVDIHINTTLSRIWVALDNKEKAEHFGAQARMLGWKATLSEPQRTHSEQLS